MHLRAPPRELVADVAPVTIWSHRRHHPGQRDVQRRTRPSTRPSSRGIIETVVDMAMEAIAGIIIMSPPVNVLLIRKIISKLLNP